MNNSLDIYGMKLLRFKFTDQTIITTIENLYYS